LREKDNGQRGIKTYMNPIKIEKGAIEALKRTIRLHDWMNELLKEDDNRC
jgi:hypothetical protein